MYKIVFFVTIFIVAEYLQVSRCKSIPELEDNLFHKINSKLQNVMNKLFSSLEINNNFSGTKIVRLLLTMYNEFKNVSENNFKTYKNIANAFKVYDNKKVTALFNLTEIIEEILRDKQFSILNSSVLKNKYNQTITTNNASYEKIINLAETSQISFKDFLSKINNITTEDIKYSSIKSEIKHEKSSTEWRQSRRKKSYNLKFWRPTKSNEEIEYNVTNRRLFNGKRADISKYPFIVSVHVLEEFMCAGSIISEDLVITAASCLLIAYKNKNYMENDITVRAGSNYPDYGGKYIAVSDIYFHPIFDPVFLTNNLAIARMKTEFYFRNTKVKIRRIEYDRIQGRVPDSVHSIMMLGWGAKEEHGGTINTEPLSSSKLNNYNHVSCANMYSWHFVADKNFCAGFMDKGGGACFRDVGGPGVVKGVLVGVVSFGPPVCGIAGAPTVFTKLGYYVHWIDSIMRKKKKLQSNVGENSRTDEQETQTSKPRKTDDSDYKFDEEYKVMQRNLSPETTNDYKERREYNEEVYVTNLTKKIETRLRTNSNFATKVPEDLELEMKPIKVNFWVKASAVSQPSHPLFKENFNSMIDQDFKNIKFTFSPTTSLYDNIFTTNPLVQKEYYNLGQYTDIFKVLHARIRNATHFIEKKNVNSKLRVGTRTKSTRGYENNTSEENVSSQLETIGNIKKFVVKDCENSGLSIETQIKSTQRYNDETSEEDISLQQEKTGNTAKLEEKDYENSELSVKRQLKSTRGYKDETSNEDVSLQQGRIENTAIFEETDYENSGMSIEIPIKSTIGYKEEASAENITHQQAYDDPTDKDSSEYKLTLLQTEKRDFSTQGQVETFYDQNRLFQYTKRKNEKKVRLETTSDSLSLETQLKTTRGYKDKRSEEKMSRQQEKIENTAKFEETDYENSELSAEAQIKSTRGYKEEVSEENISRQQAYDTPKDKDSSEYKVTLLQRKIKTTAQTEKRGSSTRFFRKTTQGHAERYYVQNRVRKYEKKVQLKTTTDSLNISTLRLDYDFFLNVSLNKNADKHNKYIDLT